MKRLIGTLRDPRNLALLAVFGAVVTFLWKEVVQPYWVGPPSAMTGSAVAARTPAETTPTQAMPPTVLPVQAATASPSGVAIVAGRDANVNLGR